MRFPKVVSVLTAVALCAAAPGIAQARDGYGGGYGGRGHNRGFDSGLGVLLGVGLLTAAMIASRNRNIQPAAPAYDPGYGNPQQSYPPGAYDPGYGYPQQGYPQQSYPQQGYGYPQQGYPQQYSQPIPPPGYYQR